MATVAPKPGIPRTRPLNYLNVERTVKSWALTTDHKRIGLMFLIAIISAFFLGGIFALLLRMELLTPEQNWVDATVYNRYFTLHGVIMVWMFLIPSIPSAFGNIMLPIMIGARDLAFPRLNLASLYLYIIGGLVVLVGALAGGVDTGWTFYPPYSSQTPMALSPIVLGVFILGISSTMTGLNFIVTTHTLRTVGMGWMRMPFFVWAIYATSIILVIATPVLGMTLLLLWLDHAYNFGIFDPAYGGDPILYQHIFWFYSHPAVYIMVLPAMGVVSELVCQFSRKNMFSYPAVVIATIGISFIGFLTWGHHMFTSGMSSFDAGVFGILSMFVAIFSAIKVFNWTATLYKGSISLATPMLYFFGFLFLFSVGGMTGVAVASTSLDVYWHDTYFVVAHFHFIMVGGTMMGFFGALHYWFPKITGRLYPERLGTTAAITVIMGFILTFVPQFLLGNAGMPRRYHTYPPEYQPLHVISTVGSWAIGGGSALVVAYLLWAAFWGRRAGKNPWGVLGLEWTTPSPPPKHNFEEPPIVTHGPYDYWRVAPEEYAADTTPDPV